LTSGLSGHSINFALASFRLPIPALVWIVPLDRNMTWLRWLKRSVAILTLYAIGILEGYYLPRYGIEWMLGAIAVTAFLAGYWMRTHWDV